MLGSTVSMIGAALLAVAATTASTTAPAVLLTQHCANSIRIRIAAPTSPNVSLGMVGALDEHCIGIHGLAPPSSPSSSSTSSLANGNVKVDVSDTSVTVTRVSDNTVLLHGPLPTFVPAKCGAGYYTIAANFTAAATATTATAARAWYGLGQIENEVLVKEFADVSSSCTLVGANLNRQLTYTLASHWCDVTHIRVT
jgi:hypothetical protein